jgi:hypothetical protein
VLDDNVHDDSWMPAALESLARLRSLCATSAHFGHDTTVYRHDVVA